MRAEIRHMERRDIDELRQKVLCAAVLEKSGWAIDRRESTRRAVKYRRGDDITIVIHDGRGWFDPLSDAKGDVFALALHLGEADFRSACAHVADLVGFTPSESLWTRPPRTWPLLPLAQRWANRLAPHPDSATWCYLHDERCLPEAILRAAIQQDLLRAGPHGSMWAAYTNDDGGLVGWEERGPRWRGFASGGAKVLFRFGAANPDRACVTEGAIDAMSLAALEYSGANLRDGSLYVATGGGWSPASDMAIRLLAGRPGLLLVAATDNNAQGDVYARRLRIIASDAGCGFERLRPSCEDWNEDLQAQRKVISGGQRPEDEEVNEGMPAACAAGASR